jgi:hypothetical protein
VTQNQQLVIIFAALLAASPALAHTTVIETTTQVIQGTGDNFSETFSFPKMFNADELISISNGYAYFGEGGTLSILVNYSNGASSQIFSSAFIIDDIALTSVALSPFTPGTIDGFTFVMGDGVYNDELTIPSGTAFDIDVSVPEPATWVTMLAGFGLVGAVMRSARRTRRVRGGDLRAELRILS